MRHWNDRPVQAEKLDEIVKAFSQTPDWEAKADWHLICLSSPEEKRMAFSVVKKSAYAKAAHALSGAASEAAWQLETIENAPLVLIPLFRRSRFEDALQGSDSKAKELATAWCVVENMLSAATKQDLGAFIRLPETAEEAVTLGTLGVPEGWMAPCFIGLGHPANHGREKPEESANAKVHHGKW